MLDPEKLSDVIRVLEDLGLRYAVTGSVAGAAWGMPRATYDADILLDVSNKELAALCSAFPPPDWYAEIEAALDAWKRAQSSTRAAEFNIIHGASATKVDFWILAGSAWDREVLNRKLRTEIAGVEGWVLSAEDILLSKLLWIVKSPSERQQQDVDGIVEVNGDRLDRRYLASWATRLGVTDLLEQALSRAWKKRDDPHA